MSEAKLISIAGPPGSGKTTCATWLARELSAQLVLENYGGNPFLSEAYAGKDELRLAGQCWFLLSRLNQLAAARLCGPTLTVTDYAFLQDEIYARIWLKGDDLAAYKALADHAAALVRKPDIVLHLDGPLEILKSRIATRARDYERFFDDAFLERLRNDHAAAVKNSGCQVIAVDIARRDLNLPDHRKWLIGQVRQHL